MSNRKAGCRYDVRSQGLELIEPVANARWPNGVCTRQPLIQAEPWPATNVRQRGNFRNTNHDHGADPEKRFGTLPVENAERFCQRAFNLRASKVVEYLERNR